MQRILVFLGKDQGHGGGKDSWSFSFSSEVFIVARLGYARADWEVFSLEGQMDGWGRRLGDGREELGEGWGQKLWPAVREGRSWRPLVVGFEAIKDSTGWLHGLWVQDKQSNSTSCWKTCTGGHSNLNYYTETQFKIQFLCQQSMRLAAKVLESMGWLP